jgi:hypothetical protein
MKVWKFLNNEVRKSKGKVPVQVIDKQIESAVVMMLCLVIAFFLVVISLGFACFFNR